MFKMIFKQAAKSSVLGTAINLTYAFTVQTGEKAHFFFNQKSNNFKTNNLESNEELLDATSNLIYNSNV